MDPTSQPVSPQADDLGYMPDLSGTPAYDPLQGTDGGPVKKPKTPVVATPPQVPAVQQASHVAAQQDPAKMAKALALAKQLNLPDVGFVYRNLDMLSGAASKAKQQQQISGVSPTLANWLSDPNNATLAKDELPPLAKVDSAVKTVGPNATTGFFPAMKNAGISGYNDVAASAYQLAMAYGMMDPATAAQAVATANQKSAAIRAIQPDFVTDFNNSMAKHRGDINRATQDFVNSQETWDQSLVDSALLGLKKGALTIGEALSMFGAAAARPRGLAYATVEGLAQMVPMILGSKVGAEAGAAGGAAIGGGIGSIVPAIGTAVGAGTGAVVGGTAGMIAGTFAGIAPLTIGQEIQQQLVNRKVDVTDPAALLRAYRDPKLMASIRLYAERKGITSSAVMALAAGFAGSLAEAAKEGGVVAKTAAKVGDVGVQAGAVAGGQLAGQVAVGEKPDVGAATQTGIQMLAYEIGQTAVGASMRAAHHPDPVEAAREVHTNTESALGAQESAQVLTEIGTAVKEAKVTSTVPDRLRQLVETATGGRDAATTYFQSDDWDKYWQSKDISPAKAAADIMGDEGRAYYESQANGSPLAIPLGDYIARVAPTEHWDGLLQSARMEPDGMTLKEADAYLTSLPATMNDLANEVGDEAKVSPEDKSAKAVRDDIHAQLVAAGVPPNEAKIQAKVYGARYKTRADIMGVDPLDLYKQRPFTINRVVETEPVILSDADVKTFNQEHAGDNAWTAAIRDVWERSGANGRREMLARWQQMYSGGGFPDRLFSPGMADLPIEDLPDYVHSQLGVERVKEGMAMREMMSGNKFEQGSLPLGDDLKYPLPAGMHSKAEQLIADKMPERATIDDVRGILKDVKAEERKWLGLDKWLNDNAGKKVTKDEVNTFLHANRLHIVEKTRGGDEPDEDRLDEFVHEAIRDTSRDLANNYWVYHNYSAEEATERFGGNREAGIYAVPDQDHPNYKRGNMEGSFEGPYSTRATANREIMREEYNRLIEDEDELEGYRVDAIRAQEEDYGSGYEQQYTLAGGENYREVLFTLPDLNNEINEEKPYESPHFDDIPNIFAHTRLKDRHIASGDNMLFMEEIQSDWHQTGREHGYIGDNTEERQKLMDAYNHANAELQQFRDDMVSKYYQYVDSDQGQGSNSRWNRVLFSRDIGTVKFTPEEDELYDKLDKAVMQAEDAGFSHDQQHRRAVPDAPFRSTWHEFVLKRMIREAAQNGYQWLGWTTGEQQNERYNLTKVVNSIHYYPAAHDEYGTLQARNAAGRIVLDEVTPKEKLQDYIGKELAVKLMSQDISYRDGTDVADEDQKGYHLYGKDLEVGGQGMKGFYDQMIPRFLNNFTKKYGGKVVDVPLDNDNVGRYYPVRYSEEDLDGGWRVLSKDENESYSYSNAEPQLLNKVYTTKEEANQAIQNHLASIKETVIHGLQLTHELKMAALMDEFSLFQMAGGPEPRGQIIFKPDGSINLNLLAQADRSTFLHETGHLWLEEMRTDVAELQSRDPASLTTEQRQLITDGATVLDYLGAGKWEDIHRMQHEMWARATEQYFMEGKAPTTPLRSAFYRFKNWLIDLYGSLTALNTTLTPQVREVMDRLLGSRDEIQQAEDKQAIRPLFEDTEALGMNEQTAADYAVAVHDAHEAAVDELSSKMAQQVQHEQSAEWKAWREPILAETTNEVNNRPVYQLLDNLRNPDSGLKLHRQSVIDTFGAEFASALPHGIMADDGMNPSILADLFGFKGTRDMITELRNAGNKDQLINFLTDQRMQQEHGTRPTMNEMKDAATEAVRGGDKRLQLIRKELELLASDNLPKLKGLIRAITNKIPPSDVVKQQAETIINGKAVRDIRPDLFEKAANRAAREARDLLLAGDRNGAFQAKLKEMLATQIYKTSMDAKQEIANAQKEFKAMFKGSDKSMAASRDVDLVHAARAVLASFGIGSTDKPAQEYLQQMAVYDPEAYHVISRMVEDATQNVKHYKDLSYQDFTAMHTLVTSMWQLARRTRQLSIAGKKVSMQSAVNELNAQLDQFNEPKVLAGYKTAVGWTDKVKMGLLGFKARMTRMESWVKVVDNGEFGGPARRYMHTPVNEGAVAHDAAKVLEMSALAENTARLKGTLKDGEIDAPELPVTDTDGNPAGNYTFSDKATGLLGALLHTGNGFDPGSNGYKLLVGRGWGKVGEDGVVDTSNWDKFIQRMWKEGKLTKVDYDWVQGVWDQFDRLKPDAWSTHKERYGFYPTERTKVKFSTPWGDYEGGYYPAKVDPFIVGSAQERAEREQLAGNNAGSYMFPSVGRGFTKSRSDLYARPLIMDASLVPTHIDAVLRFTHLAIPIADVGRLMLNKEFRTKLDAVDPTVGSDLLRPFLDRAATQRIDLPMKGVAGQAMDRIADYVRTSSSMQIMAFNSVVTLEMGTHFAGVLAVPDVKIGHLLSSFWTMIHQPRLMAADVNERSPFMRTRNSAGLDAAREDINRVMLDPSVLQKTSAFVSDNATALMHGFQWVMDHATWTAVYDHLSEDPNITEEEAARRADFVVRDVLGTYRPQDRAAIEAGNVFKRMALMFYGFFNTRQNYLHSEAILASRMGLRKGAGRLMVLVPLAFMLPAIAGKGVKVAMSDKPYREPDEDEGHLLARFFGDATEEMAVRMTPFAGPLIDMVARGFNKQSHSSDELLSSPAITMVENAAHAPGEVYKAIHDGMYNDKSITDLFTLIGMATRFPMRPIAKVVNYLHRQSTGVGR